MIINLQPKMKNTVLNGSDLQSFLKRRNEESKKINGYLDRITNTYKLITRSQKEIAYLDDKITNLKQELKSPMESEAENEDYLSVEYNS